MVLEPDLASARFRGRVSITCDVIERSDLVALNALELEIEVVEIDGVNAAYELDEQTERLLITPSAALQPGVCTIGITFTGTLNDKLRGFYRSTYSGPARSEQDDAPVEHVIGTTQMQPTDCRRAFPCWDEPEFKATFAVTLVVDEGLAAVSNGAEIERTKVGDGKVAVRFAETMPMSTYLVAFVVGRLEPTDAVDVDGVPMRVVHVPGKARLTGLGLDVGAFALRWFQDYYGIPYPSDKVDLLALPDFAAGAMENLGCITFRESLLLVDPATSTQNEQQLVADVVAHELAHMWFGDLVTMRWWNGIWLNEAFATFMEVAAVDAFRPDWKRWESFSLERSVAFETDALASTRPIEFEVRAPHDCEAMFDVLTYQKGAALLRMLEQYIGPERFRQGVAHYLRTHEYGNTETSDLWDAIEHVVDKDGGNEPVRTMMDSWIWQPGFPLVAAVADGGDLVLRQQRFGYDAGAADGTRWVVPIHVRDDEGTRIVLIDGDEARVPLRGAGAVVVNAGGHAFVRVAYDAELRGRLGRDTLGSLSVVERYALVDDAWNAVLAGRLSAMEFLDVVDEFSGERDLAVWQAIAVGLRGVHRLTDDEAALDGFRAIVRTLVAPALDDLSWEPQPGEDDLRGKLRGLLVSLLAVVGGDADAQARARELFERSLSDPLTVHPELAAAATNVVAATGDVADYERFVDRFRSAATPQEQLRSLYALADFDSDELVERTAEWAFSSSDVKTQNAPFLLQRTIANRNHGARAWAIVRRRWDDANAAFPNNTIIRMIDSVKLLNTPQLEADVHAFFAEHGIPQAGKTLDQVLERQRVNTAVRAREEQRLTDALRRPR